MEKHKPIILAAELFQQGQETCLTYYCSIPDERDGFMYIRFEMAPDKSFWKGLETVLRSLSKTYSHYPLSFAFPQGYMTLQGGIYRQQAMTFLEMFPSYDFISDEPYMDSLSITNSMGKTDKKAPRVLHGYKMNQYEQRKIAIKQEQLSVTRGSKNPMYEGFTMPIEGVVLDFEATSIIAEYARIIEISALRFKNGNIVDELHTFVNPDIKIPKSVRELTGITQEDIEPAPRSTIAMKNLLSFLKGSSVVVGHNISYDYGLLITFCSRFHLPVWEGSLLCTRSLAKKAQLEVKDYSLDALCKCFGIHNERPHQAWSDTRATFELMKSLYRDSFLI